jgi:heavy metal sensor kinase
MKSIRLSLLLYFLVLLTVVLGAVSVWAYQFTYAILEANGQVQEKLLKKQCDSDCERERNRFDKALEQKAQNLASQARIQHHLIEYSAVRSMFTAEIEFPEDFLLPPSGDDHAADYFIQINTERAIPWYSPSLGNRWFAFDLDKFRRMNPYDPPQYDEPDLPPGLPVPVLVASLALANCPLNQKPLLSASALFSERTEPGLKVRRVAIKVPVGKWGPRPSRPEKAPSLQSAPRGPNPPPPDVVRKAQRPFSERRDRPQEAGDRPAPAFYIQCAAETTKRDQHVRALQADLQSKLANLRDESETTLSNLRDRLLLIGVVTFSATVVGGVWLVRLGLSPLQRLSEAVSRVSAKDFRLPFDEPRLPRELRPIVKRLTQTLELLKRTFAREKQAAADISHELRTPLAALLTTTEVALRKPRSAEEYRELLADCHATGQQMSQLIERLLALARLDAGVDTLRPREVDVSNLAQQCATLVRPLVAARGLTLRMERNGPVMLHTDPDKLREVLTNLLHNAIQYNRPEGSIELALERENGRVLVEVRDTGIGIAPEAREHIFERFYRADPSRQSDGLHAGLGLAIAKGYIDLMGGKISVQSTEGQGTTFRLELPA